MTKKQGGKCIMASGGMDAPVYIYISFGMIWSGIRYYDINSLAYFFIESPCIFNWLR